MSTSTRRSFPANYAGAGSPHAPELDHSEPIEKNPR
jgi:hypothetical protein